MLRLSSLCVPIALLTALAGAAGGCASNPEATSGDDAFRIGAEAMVMDEWVAGDINADDGDRTDWKHISLDGAGKLAVELAADEAGAALAIGVFDRYGQPLGSTTRPAGSGGPVKVMVKARRGGRHFIMIRQTSGDPTAYSVRASMDIAEESLVPDI